MPPLTDVSSVPAGIQFAWVASLIGLFLAMWAVRKWRDEWIDSLLIGSIVVIEVLLLWISVRVLFGRNEDQLQAWLPSLAFVLVAVAFWVWRRGWGFPLAAVLIFVAMPFWLGLPSLLVAAFDLDVLAIAAVMAAATLIGAELSWPGRRPGLR
ncbi:MAG: hypothetical protein QOJ81_817 [Chloroflexota bacterium]|nr:hypothetical protein [Chloroflexota bacterium]